MTYFKQRQYPRFGAKKPTNGNRKDKKNYDYKWEKLSQDFRRKNPFCKFCAQDGFEVVPVEDVDHIIPIEDGGSRLDWSNLQSLCKRHHYGRKERLQQYARKHGLINQLPLWCDSPEDRPDLTKRR